MLVPDTLFFYICNNRGIRFLPAISLYSVRGKRWWKNKSKEEKTDFSKMRSEVQKNVFANRSEKEKKEFFSATSKAKKEFWDNVDDEWKENHIDKMSSGMKKAWEEGDEDFGSRVAHEENIKALNGNLEIIDNLPRINDYAGVITASEMVELNG